VASQRGAVAGQSAFVLQPAQTPVAALQSCEFFGHIAFVVHAGWQVWSPGKHAGAATPQSVLERHAPQVPVPAMQKGAVAGHWLSAVHWTQPSVTSHCWPCRHWFVPLIPQTALPPPGPPAPPVMSEDGVLEPPHATTTAAAANVSVDHVLNPKEAFALMTRFSS